MGTDVFYCMLLKQFKDDYISFRNQLETVSLLKCIKSYNKYLHFGGKYKHTFLEQYKDIEMTLERFEEVFEYTIEEFESLSNKEQHDYCRLDW